MFVVVSNVTSHGIRYAVSFLMRYVGWITIDLKAAIGLWAPQEMKANLSIACDFVTLLSMQTARDWT